MKKTMILMNLALVLCGPLAHASLAKIQCEGHSQHQKFEIVLSKDQPTGLATVILENGLQLSGEYSIKPGAAGTRLAGSKILEIQAKHYIPGFSKPHTVLSAIAVSLVLTGPNPQRAGGSFTLSGLDSQKAEDTVGCVVGIN